jgi:hypothetical protein
LARWKTVKIDALGQNVAQRIEAHEIEIIWREDPSHQIHDKVGWRCVQGPPPHKAIGRGALQRTHGGGARYAPPEFVERGARAIGSCLGPAVRQHGSVHSACRRPGDPGNSEPILFKQTVEHAPGECAMRAAALKGQINQNRITLVAQRHLPPPGLAELG